MARTKTLPPKEVRVARARKGAQARHSLDSYIRTVVARAPELTAEQRARLAALFSSPPGGATA